MSTYELWKRLLRKTNGRFFGVVFTKKNGGKRRLNGKFCQDQNGNRHLLVWDAQKRGFRKVDTSTIEEFNCAELSL